VSDYVKIANLAGTKIGSDARITSREDDRFFARTIRALWDIERQAALRDSAANFAIKRIDLAAEAVDTVPYPWASTFKLPPDCLRFLEILNEGSARDYQIEGKSVLSNSLGPLYIRYLADIEEPALWDALFIEAFACRLAWNAGPRVAGSAYDATRGERDYRMAISAFRRVDASENPPIDMRESEWIEARWSRNSQTYGAERGWFE
jgi:hypothetical protein